MTWAIMVGSERYNEPKLLPAVSSPYINQQYQLAKA
jgi:hypothetical protein